MGALKKYDLAGKELGEVSVDDALLNIEVNGQLIKDYIVALRANARQWSASTKGRAQVAHSGQKPHPQKGTGRARQGYLGSPQYKGGGRVFGPKPKFDQHVSINKKERRAAIRSLLAEKIQANRVHVLEMPSIRKPKTKKVAEFMRACGLEGKRVLFLREKDAKENAYEVLLRSMANIPFLEAGLLSHVNGYDLAVSHDLVIMEPALEELMLLLGGNV